MHKTLFLFLSEKPREACFDPGNIMNASRTGYDYKLGSQVSYNCHHGYTTVGGQTITCVMGHDGKPVWDKPLPSCKGRTDLWFNTLLHTYESDKVAHHLYSTIWTKIRNESRNLNQGISENSVHPTQWQQFLCSQCRKRGP